MGPEKQAATLRVVAVYENTVTEERALYVCDHMVQLIGPGWIRAAGWRMETLKDRGILQEAVSAAAVADIILISTHASETVPHELSEWCEAWLARRRADGGILVALVDLREKPDPPRCAILDFVARTAARARLTFLRHNDALAGQFPKSLTDTIRQATNPANHLPGPMTPFRHWGINE